MLTGLRDKGKTSAVFTRCEPGSSRDDELVLEHLGQRSSSSVLLGSFRLTSFCNLEASICIDIDQSLALNPTISGYRRCRRGWLRGSTSANGSDVSASKALLVTEGPSNVKSALASFAYQDHVRLARSEVGP